MRRKTVFHIGIILLIALTIVGSAASQPAPLFSGPAPALKLKVGTFVPSQQSLPMAQSLQIDGFGPGQSGYYIVQFNSPIQEAWKAQIEAAGGTIVEYIPDYAFKVRLNPAQLLQVSKIGNVIWTGIFQPAYKISPDLTRNGIRLYKVRVEADAAADAARSAIGAAGAQIIRQDGNFLVVAADQSQINALANITDVAWIENFVLYEKHNEYGAGVIMGANVANASGYDGSTQIAAVADTGLGTGSGTPFADIPSSRIVTIQDFPAASASGCYNAINDGARDVDSGHGTHTAVSIVGDGNASGVGKGTAPAARLVFQAVEDFADMISICSLQYADGYYLLGLPDDLTNLYQPAYNAGARVHSNSWGSDAAGDYTADSATTDTFMWNNPDMLITFSAGNAGTDANSDGIIDNDSMGSPATAKNVLTVGASENDRQGNWNCDTSLSYTTCASQGGQNDIFTYGAAWPSDYPANPIASDPSAGNSEQMGAFSSRGPTDDGRIKPDVVAPGTWVLSGYSDLYQQGYDSSPNPQNGAWQYDGYGFPYNNQYKYMSGTSMSNPLAAGAATVVRDYYNKAHSHNASAALVKATLINTAVDLLDENNDGVNDNDYPIPNNHEGWGRINLAAATDGSQQYVDNTTGISTGGSVNYQYSIASSGFPFKVSLVWTDYPSTAAAGTNLVNNLNLVVTAPNGTTIYRGNVFSGGWSQTGGTADSVNNVENVYVQSAAAGTWTVTISGANVPQGPQPFALVVDGQFGVAPTPTNTPIPPTNTPGPSPTPVTPTATPTGPVCVTYSSTDTPINIPNGVASITSGISVSGTSGTISDVNVSVDMPHAWVGDLIFSVSSPGSTNVTIIDRPGVPASTYGCSGDDILATLDDAASSPVENQCAGTVPTINGTFSPNNALSTFNGQTANGTWTLRVQDAYTSGDAGSLDGWSIEICTNGPAPTATSVPPTNTPVPPTNTPVPPTATATSVPPTATSIPPTATATSVPPTATSVPPTATATSVPPTPTPAPGGDVIYVSSSTNGTAGGVGFADEDIVSFDTGSSAWAMVFDGSDVGVASDINAFDFLTDGSIVMSFDAGTNVPGIGSVDDSDMVRFIPSSLGDNTSGTFVWYFDGSDVGLSTSGEDVDAVDVLDDGRILISTTGSYSVTGASGVDEDLIVFTPSNLGSTTNGSWALYFDGSDVGLSTSSTEDVTGTWQDGNGNVYLTTLGAFSVTGVSGDGADIFVCAPGSLGSTTSCTFSMYWDGSLYGFAGEVVDGIYISQ
ncbi:MAG: S8 family serine peptidase [Ardenticatenaceae bacterium]|nr:S8 family serine peptidase [Ardenticatenaceae bacterium]MCB9442958.1 S8 family serine peptidase [Ardenticatenaceae bacterium]